MKISTSKNVIWLLTGAVITLLILYGWTIAEKEAQAQSCTSLGDYSVSWSLDKTNVIECAPGEYMAGIDCTGDCGTNRMRIKCASFLP